MTCQVILLDFTQVQDVVACMTCLKGTPCVAYLEACLCKQTVTQPTKAGFCDAQVV